LRLRVDMTRATVSTPSAPRLLMSSTRLVCGLNPSTAASWHVAAAMVEAMPYPARASDFHLGAPVHASDGHHVGSLHRLVVDAESWDPREIIVQETKRFSGHVFAAGAGLLTDDIIVPMDRVARVAHDRVDLTIPVADVRRLPPYLSFHYAPVEGRDVANMAIRVLSSGYGGAIGPRLVEAADKAPGEIEIRPGENVMLGHDGHKFGQVRDVLFDEGELVGIVVHPTGLLTHDVVIQVRFLDRSDDTSLFVSMTPDEVERLAAFGEAAG
jgi:sporulation protein YlmC with PRC-barrel domain